MTRMNKHTAKTMFFDHAILHYFDQCNDEYCDLSAAFNRCVERNSSPEQMKRWLEQARQ